LEAAPSATTYSPANELQCSFAQHVGIALAVTGKFDDLAGDTLFDVVVAVSGPQSDANKFEGNTEDTPGLGVELLAVKERGDRHSNASGEPLSVIYRRFM
jgi:hypothetical protein